MIRSMTGFGSAARQIDGIHYGIELRSLNNKFFKATIRLPEIIAGLEAELESRLRRRVYRGSFTLTGFMRQSDAQAVSHVNETALMSYLNHLETIHSKVTDHAVQIDLTQLLALPGVLQPAEDDEARLNAARPVMLELLDQAVERMDAMRVTEGEALREDILAHRDQILQRVELIRERAPSVVEEYHQRLRARIDELMARAEMSVSEPDLVREVAIFADRADISEELSRTIAHLDQLAQILDTDSDEPSGRTLDFLAQELLREANTIASKSNDAQISRAIVEVKGAIDRIKEQVQNIE